MFRESTNEQAWRRLVEATCAQEDVLPLRYYKPYKCSKLWLRQNFPEWDLNDYTDKFYHAEQYFNVTKFDDNYYSNQKYVNFKAFLTGHCLAYPSPFCTV